MGQFAFHIRARTRDVIELGLRAIAISRHETQGGLEVIARRF
jgi:hypothetical protein